MQQTAGLHDDGATTRRSDTTIPACLLRSQKHTRAHAYSKHRPNHMQAHTCTSHSSTSVCSLNHTPGGSCLLLLAPWTAAEASVLQLQEEQVPQIVSFPKHFSSLSSTLLPRLHRFLRHVSFTWVGDTVLWLPMM